MSRTTDRQVVNGTEYLLMDSEARSGVVATNSKVASISKSLGVIACNEKRNLGEPIMFGQTQPRERVNHYPLTVKKAICLSGFCFGSYFTAECDFTIKITNTARDTVYGESTIHVLQGGNEMYIPLCIVLEAGEYKIVCECSTGTQNYYNVSSTNEDDYISNAGTSYWYNNSNIKFGGEIDYYVLNEHWDFNEAQLRKAVSSNKFKTDDDYWDMTNVSMSSFFVPLTVIDCPVFVERISFAAKFTEACTFAIKLVNAAGNMTFAYKDVVVSAPGKTRVSCDFLCLLQPGEYRIRVSVTSGYISYPYTEDRSQRKNDGFIKNSGSEYQYNNDGFVYLGEIDYLPIKIKSFVEKLSESIVSDDFIIKPFDVFKTPASAGGGWTINDDEYVCNYTGTTGNSWVSLPIDLSKVVNGFVKVSAYPHLQSGSSFRSYIRGKSTESGNDIYISCQDYLESKAYTQTIDLNHMVVYNDLDLSKNIDFLIANRSAPCYGYVDNVEVVSGNFTLDDSKSFIENIEDMKKSIDENTNAIKSMGDSYLVSPDGSKFALAVTNDGTLISIPAIPNKTLFIGNSLLLGNGFGMCASAEDKDYYYYVSQAILAKKPTATFDKISGTGFESCTSVEDADTWMEGTLLSHLENDINLVIIQLGDNVNTAEKQTAFDTTCERLINYIKNNAQAARIAWAGEWYAGGHKQQTIATACANTGATFIDLTPLLGSQNNSYIGAVINYGTVSTRTYTFTSYSDNSADHEVTVNFAIDNKAYSSVVPYTSFSVSGSQISITGTYGIVTNGGVASHPGDNGMLAIGNLMIEKLGLD